MLLSVLMAGSFLAICSKSSFLYPMNDWVDVNCYFTMGRGLVHGKVIYAELFEQKGPLLYFLYGIVALISEHSFIGVYFLEVAAFALFLYYSGKCAELYLGNGRDVCFAMLVLAAVIPMSPAFEQGASAEEICLFLLSYSLYQILYAVKNQKEISGKAAFGIGISAAAALWIKYTFCGFYAGLALFVIIYYRVDKYSYKQLLRTMAFFVSGVMLLSVAVISYFVYHGAVLDLAEVYFYDNIFVYPGKKSALWILEFIWYCINTVLQNYLYAQFILVGLLWFFCNIKKRWRESLAVYLSFGCLAITAIGPGRYHAYTGLILSAFSVFGIVAFVKVYRHMGEICPVSLPPSAGRIGICLLPVAMLVCAYVGSGNVYLMKYQKQDMPQYQFAEIMSRTESATLLNYGFLDGGFYYAAGITPVGRFFCKLNVELPEMMEEQNDIVEQGAVDFVVTRDHRLEDYGIDASVYRCVEEIVFGDHAWQHTYYLYQKQL